MNNNILSEQKQSQSGMVKITILLIVIAGICFFAYKKSVDNSNQKQQEQQSEIVLQQQLILKQTDVINTNWLRTLNPLVKNVEGRVVWSNILQEGVMEFIGLPKIKNNQNYQLWVYDLQGNDSKPTLASEFISDTSNKLLVAFTTKLEVNTAFKFELTLKTADEEATQPLLLAQP